MLKLLRSFRTAFLGIAWTFRSEQNMRIHCAIATGVIVAGFGFNIAPWEWVAVVFCIGGVIAAECINTAIERLADRVSTDIHPLTGMAKDCGAAGVLVLSITAAVVGAIIFLPKVWAAIGY